MDILKNNKRTVLLLSAVILVNTGLQILVPRFLSAFIDRAETNAPMTAIALIMDLQSHFRFRHQMLSEKQPGRRRL